MTGISTKKKLTRFNQTLYKQDPVADPKESKESKQVRK